MSRPLKNNLNYFNIDCQDDIKMKLLIKKFGVKGFGFYISLLKQIYSENYYIDFSDDSKELFYIESGLELTEFNNIFDYLIEKNFFNKILYQSHKIITSAGIQKRWVWIMTQLKRKAEITNFNLINSEETPINSEETPINSEETPINSELMQQKKIKESKESKLKETKEIKRNDIDISMPFTPPDDIKSIQIIFSDWNNIICKQYPEFQKITESEFEMDIKLQQLLFRLKDKWETAEILTLYGTNEWLRLNAKFLKWWNINNYEKALQGKFVSYKQNATVKVEEDEHTKYIRRRKEWLTLSILDKYKFEEIKLHIPKINNNEEFEEIDYVNIISNLNKFSVSTEEKKQIILELLKLYPNEPIYKKWYEWTDYYFYTQKNKGCCQFENSKYKSEGKN